MTTTGRVGVAEQDGTPIVTMEGDFDLSNAQLLHDAFVSVSEGAPECVVIEMSGTTYLDSTALRAMYRFVRSGMTVVVRGANGHPRQVLEIAGLERAGMQFEP